MPGIQGALLEQMTHLFPIFFFHWDNENPDRVEGCLQFVQIFVTLLLWGPEAFLRRLVSTTPGEVVGLAAGADSSIVTFFAIQFRCLLCMNIAAWDLSRIKDAGEMAYGGNWRNDMVAQSQDLTSSGLSMLSLTRHVMQSSDSIGGLVERM
jgi:hypothetical protein